METLTPENGTVFYGEDTGGMAGAVANGLYWALINLLWLWVIIPDLYRAAQAVVIWVQDSSLHMSL